MGVTATTHVQDTSGRATADLLRSQFVVAYPSLPSVAATIQQPDAAPGPGVATQIEVAAAEPSQVTGADVRWVTIMHHADMNYSAQAAYDIEGRRTEKTSCCGQPGVTALH